MAKRYQIYFKQQNKYKTGAGAKYLVEWPEPGDV